MSVEQDFSLFIPEFHTTGDELDRKESLTRLFELLLRVDRVIQTGPV